VQYMSPEQLEGAEADARSDIFAFGCVLYEMITGQKAFQGKSKASLISAILTNEPQPVGTVQSTTPPALDHVIRKCLAKNPDDRWQSARDIRHALEFVQNDSVPLTSAKTRLRWALWITAGVVLLAAATFLAVSRGRVPATSDAVSFAVYPPEKSTF